jgi:DNA-binding MarR family transcriptional regulator
LDLAIGHVLLLFKDDKTLTSEEHFNLATLAGIYAAHGAPEYGIINMCDRKRGVLVDALRRLQDGRYVRESDGNNGSDRMYVVTESGEALLEKNHLTPTERLKDDEMEKSRPKVEEIF